MSDGSNGLTERMADDVSVSINFDLNSKIYFP